MQKIENAQMSFWQLISESSKIEIPIIQRDYAQGREDGKTKKLRKLFLEKIITTITTNNESLELDFVYGNNDSSNIFQPLDGQQRLTTLFLLHWFVAQRENQLDELVKVALLKFTYETRVTSRDFCTNLVENAKQLGVGETISEQIQDAPWFFLAWKKDPTIKSMLTMLNDIEIEINKNAINNLWERLISNENPPIVFYFKELNDIGLTDDLYIKMNARGKALTPFENFKARFEKNITEKQWETKTDITKTFSHKIDTIWTDLFWNHRNSENQIDNAFIKFIAGTAINFYAQNNTIIDNQEEQQFIQNELEKKGQPIREDVIKRERIERKIVELFNNPNEVNLDDFFNEESFKYLKSSLGIYAVNHQDNLIPQDVNLWTFCKENSTLFKEFIKESSTTYQQRALFYAQTIYLTNNQNFNRIFFSDWMRVIRNIVHNSIIDSASSFVSAITLISELSGGSSNIYDYLSQNEIKSRHASVQIKEEQIKAKLITSENDKWKLKIVKAENHLLFRGCIRFLLNDYPQNDLEIQKIRFETFNDRLKVAEEIFDENGLTKKYRENSIFLRAFVSRFNIWDQLFEPHYDNTAEHWREIFKSNLLKEPLEKILDVDYNQLFEFIKEDSFFAEKRKEVHEDLYKSQLLSAITEGSYLHWKYDVYILYFHNAKSECNKYIIASKRNNILASLTKEQIISTTQQLYVNNSQIPFFWGWNIEFRYKDKNFIWGLHDQIIYNQKSFYLKNDNIIELLDSILENP